MDTLELNKETDKIFKSIAHVAIEYLNFNYPAAPDPDNYIQAIELYIQKYKSLK